jgi:prepilin-type N-terminal cleavage/methylation domain-containing protein
MEGNSLRKRTGLSLVELMVAITIMAITVGFGLPRLLTMTDRAAVSSARDQVLSALSTARTTAVRRAATATFYATGNTIWVTADSSGTEITVLNKISLLGNNKVTLTTTGNTSKIAFNMRGMSGSSSGRIHVSRGSKSDSVCVTALGSATKLSCL